MKRPFLIASTAPCPHCGSGHNQLACHGSATRDGTPEKLVYQVVCAKCRASGPLAQSADEAAKGWAHRAQPRLNEAASALLPEVEFEEESAA
jgi:hypothetical protein